jgi:predicted HTH transcriptional regulator
MLSTPLKLTGLIAAGENEQTEFKRRDYPMDALREIVINMIVHRDYTHASESVIKIFDDHIEFYNPGKLLGGLSVPRLLTGNYISTIRNKQKKQLLKLVQENPRITRSELAVQLSKSESTVKEHLAQLKAQGRLQRIGSDRSGSWQVIIHEE